MVVRAGGHQSDGGKGSGGCGGGGGSGGRTGRGGRVTDGTKRKTPGTDQHKRVHVADLTN